jgi:hypothetical protein
MGYYEQIGSENRRYREERAKHKLRHKLIEWKAKIAVCDSPWTYLRCSGKSPSPAWNTASASSNWLIYAVSL